MARITLSGEGEEGAQSVFWRFSRSSLDTGTGCALGGGGRRRPLDGPRNYIGTVPGTSALHKASLTASGEPSKRIWRVGVEELAMPWPSGLCPSRAFWSSGSDGPWVCDLRVRQMVSIGIFQHLDSSLMSPQVLTPLPPLPRPPRSPQTAHSQRDEEERERGGGERRIRRRPKQRESPSSKQSSRLK